MGDNVTQVEGLDFVVADHATPAAASLSKAFQQVDNAFSHASSSAKGFSKNMAIGALGAVGLSYGLRDLLGQAKSANVVVDDSAKKIAGVTFAFGGWKAGTSAQERWTESLEEGHEVVNKLEKDESRLKMTRADLAEVYKASYALSERYGLSQAQQIDVTEKLAAVQKVLGVSAEGASTQMSRMALTGNMRVMDDFSKALRFSIGNIAEFHKMSEPKRFAAIQKALGDLVPAAEGMGKGISGSMFDVRKAIDDLTRDVTGPVFKEVSHDFAEWAHHLGEVRASGQSLAHEFGDKLVWAFHAIEGASKFTADHWRAIVGILVANKLAGMAGGLAQWGKGSAAAGGEAGGAMRAAVVNVSAATVNIGGPAATALGGATTKAIETGMKGGLESTVGNLAGMASKAFKAIETGMKGGLESTVGNLAGMASKAFGVTEALGVLYVGLEALAGMIDKWHTDAIAKEAQFGKDSVLAGGSGKAIVAALDTYREMADKDLELGRNSADTAKQAHQAYIALKAAYGAGVVGEGGKVNVGAAKEAYSTMTAETRSQQLSALGMDANKAYYNTDQVQKEFADRLAEVLANLFGASGDSTKPPSMREMRKPPQVNIQHLEITQDFKDRDPDRIFHRTINDVIDLAHNPQGATTRTI
jgi:hypothetical protein